MEQENEIVSSSSTDSLKQTYVHLHIVDEGYDIEEFAMFLSDQPPKYTSKLSMIPMNMLKNTVDRYVKIQHNKLLQAQSQMKRTESQVPMTRSVSKFQFDEEHIEFYRKQVRCIQESNKFGLTKVAVEIVSYTENKGGVFGKDYITYKIELRQLHKVVERRFSDFEWLSTMLTQSYPGVVIPPLPRKKMKRVLEDSHVRKKGQMLQSFLLKCLTIPEVLHDEHIYRFLTIDSRSKFEEYRKSNKPTKEELCLEKLKTPTGFIPIGITKSNLQKIDESKKYFEFMEPSLKQYAFFHYDDRVYKQIKRIQQNFESISRHFDNLHELSTKISPIEKNFRQNIIGSEERSIFQILDTIFPSYQEFYNRLKALWNKQFYTKFKYEFHHSQKFNQNLSQYKQLQKSFQSKREQLDKKKAKLYNEPLAKWKIEEDIKASFYQQKPSYQKAATLFLPEKTKQLQKLQERLALYTEQIATSIAHYSKKNNKHIETFSEKLLQKDLLTFEEWTDKLAYEMASSGLESKFKTSTVNLQEGSKSSNVKDFFSQFSKAQKQQDYCAS